VNAFNDHHFAFKLNFTSCFRGKQAVASRDSARFQRAAKRARQSTGGRCDNVIQRRRMRLMYLRIDFIMFGHFRMDPKENWVLFHRQKSPAQRTFYSFNSNMGCVYDTFSHKNLLNGCWPGDELLKARLSGSKMYLPAHMENSFLAIKIAAMAAKTAFAVWF